MDEWVGVGVWDGMGMYGTLKGWLEVWLGQEELVKDDSRTSKSSQFRMKG